MRRVCAIIMAAMMRTAATRRLHVVTPLLPLVAVIVSCAAPTPESPADEFIDDAVLAAVNTGETSKGELRRILGRPDWSFGDGARWIYKTERSSDGKTDAEFAFVEFQFDADSVVADQKEFSIQSGTCDDANRCFDWSDNALTVYASAEADTAAKEFEASPGQCALYVYSDASFNAVTIRVDAARTSQQFRANDGYARIDLDDGLQTITLTYSSLLNEASRTNYVNCDAGAIFFIREQHDARENFVVEIVPDATGRAAILERRLVVLPDPGVARPRIIEEGQT